MTLNDAHCSINQSIDKIKNTDNTETRHNTRKSKQHKNTAKQN